MRGVGSYKKGTALNGSLVSDIVVMFRDLPTGQYCYYYTLEPPSKGRFGTSHLVPCKEAVLVSKVESVLQVHIIMVIWEVSFVERLSLSWRVFY